MNPFRGRGNPFGRKRVEFDGLKFDSKLEAECYKMLRLWQMAGKIKTIEQQPRVYLTKSKILYKPDFKIMDLEIGREVFVEAKGFETSDWRIKCRLWKNYGPGLLRIYKSGRQGLILTEEIEADISI